MIRPALRAPLLILLVGLAFRFAILSQYRSTSPDGDQYYKLEQSLTRDGRYAYSPRGELTYTRLPGYPLFLAALALGRPSPPDADLLRACVANELLDAGTALLAFAIVLQLLRGHRRARVLGCVAMALVLACPISFLFASYRLTESLATFLTTLELYLVLRAMRERTLLYAGLAGLAAGLGQLVRADAITAAPAVALALCFAGDFVDPLRRRAVAIALAASVALAGWSVVMAPWAARNLVRFGAPHLAAAEWPALDGHELPTGILSWMRTWAAGRVGDADIAGLIVFGRPLGPAQVQPRMVSSPDERARVEQLFAKYDAGGRLTPEVDEGFRALAGERFHKSPLRWLITLPALRFVQLYRAPRHADFPLRVWFLGLPPARPAFDAWNLAMYALAIAGAVALARRRESRRILLVLACAIAGRTLLHLWAVPPFVSQRYLVEVLPLFLVLAACAPALAREPSS